MIKFSSLKPFDQWVTRQAKYPGETPEVKAQNIETYKAVLLLLAMAVLLTLLAWILQIRVMILFGIGMLLQAVISVPLITLAPHKTKLAISLSHTLCLLLSFWAVVNLGGITHSGGIFLWGLVTVLFITIYHDKKLFLWSFGPFILTLLLEVVLQPFLTRDPEMTESKGLIMLAANSLLLSVAVLWLFFRANRKNAELASMEMQKKEALEDMKTHLYTNIAHEFRTPLTLINGMADMIHEYPHQQIGERTENIKRNADRLLRLVDQMLNLSRLEDGSMTIHKIQSDIIAFLSYIAQSYKGLFEYRQVRLHCLPDNKSFVMDFDPEKTEEIFSNLISNALKYTPAGGDVYISCHLVESDPQTFAFKVKDTGIGIAEDELDHIFDQFYKTASHTRPHEEGNGIGLTIAREYVKLLGGKIRVESSLGSGAEFTVHLPITHESPVHKAADFEKEIHPVADPVDFNREEPGTQQASLPQILIIEDNIEIIQYLQLILGEKFRLRCTGNGEEGIRIALEHIPDLVLSNVMLPGKDGFEVCGTLKNDFRTSHIPVVLLTARADQASRISGLEHGADAYLIKPFNKRELMACLQNQLNLREKLRIKYSSSQVEQTGGTTAGYDEIFLKNVRSILDQEYPNEVFGIEELCKKLDISRVQLHRKLIALTGQPASHYIRSFRLTKAKEMLRTTIKSISEIAYETGFSDANYFSRVFSQEFGTPPSTLRKGKQAI